MSWAVPGGGFKLLSSGLIMIYCKLTKLTVLGYFCCFRVWLVVRYFLFSNSVVVIFLIFFLMFFISPIIHFSAT